MIKMKNKQVITVGKQSHRDYRSVVPKKFIQPLENNKEEEYLQLFLSAAVLFVFVCVNPCKSVDSLYFHPQIFAEIIRIYLRCPCHPRSIDAKPRNINHRHLCYIREKSRRICNPAGSAEVKYRSVEVKRRSVEAKHRSAEAKRQSAEAKHRSVEARHRSVEARHRSVEVKRRSVEARHRSVEVKQSTIQIVASESPTGHFLFHPREIKKNYYICRMIKLS
jgi:hypothetical protein